MTKVLLSSQEQELHQFFWTNLIIEFKTLQNLECQKAFSEKNAPYYIKTKKLKKDTSTSKIWNLSPKLLKLTRLFLCNNCSQ